MEFNVGLNLDSRVQDDVQHSLRQSSIPILKSATKLTPKFKKHDISEYIDYYSTLTPEYLAKGSMMFDEVIHGFLLQLSNFKNSYDDYSFVIPDDGDGKQKFTLYYDSSVPKFPNAMEEFMVAVKGNSKKNIHDAENNLQDVVKGYDGLTIGLLCREKRFSCILHKLARMYINGDAPELKDIYALRLISPNSYAADAVANSVHYELNRLKEFKVCGPVKRKNLPGHSSRGITSDYGGYTFCTQITDINEHINDQKDRPRFVDSRNEIVERAISKGHSVSKLFELCAPINGEFAFRYS